MANKGLFASTKGKYVPPADTKNEAGGRAYKRSSEEALAVYAATGCLNGTFYATAEEQLDKALAFASECSDDFVARTAIYARQSAFMKDMPALLCAVLCARKSPCLQVAFPQVIDNGRMLRNFVQIVRSGVTGRKSLGSSAKRLVQGWLNSRSPERLFRDSVGQDPSIADVIKMVHPKPADPARTALYAYLIGKPTVTELLPDLVLAYEGYKLMMNGGPVYEDLAVPDVPFQMLTALGLGKKEWTEIARNAPWGMTRMNLNTFQRHGVFEVPGMIHLISERLRNPELIRRSRVFPYQLLMAYKASGGGPPKTRRYVGHYEHLARQERAKSPVPHDIQEALQDALDIALENVPEMHETLYVCPDVSGSMRSPVTGKRKGSTSKVQCVDVAALVAAALLRVNKRTSVLPFECDVVSMRLNPRDSVMTNAQKLASVGGGGTNCSAPLKRLNDKQAIGDLVVFVSDYESWVDSSRSYLHGNGTGMLSEWSKFKARNPRAKLICININPNPTTQVKEREDIIQVAGFSDQVFHLIAAVAEGHTKAGYWLGKIGETPLNEPRP